MAEPTEAQLEERYQALLERRRQDNLADLASITQRDYAPWVHFTDRDDVPDEHSELL